MARYYRRRTSRVRPRRSRRASRSTRTYSRRRFSFRRRSGGTASSIVKLTLESAWDGYNSTTRTWAPFSFNPFNLPGFDEYKAVYSEFRIKKCVIKINRGPNTNLAYLIAPSRTFATSAGPITPTGTDIAAQIVPPQLESALRQTRYQKELMPNTITGKVRVGFHPYTMVGTYGPTTAFTSTIFTRIWNLNRWTPMSWSSTARPVYCYGPYVCLNDALTNADPPPGSTVFNMVLEVYLQFKGQK